MIKYGDQAWILTHCKPGRTVITPVPHICRNLLISKDLWQTHFSRSDAQIGTDISIAATGCVEEFARDVRKVRNFSGESAAVAPGSSLAAAWESCSKTAAARA
jgi:hypothetical protein